MAQLIAIGFWTDRKHPSWPGQQEFIDPDLDEAESRQVARYLDQGTIVRVWRGWSHCRICGYDRNGDSDLSDGTYLWPEGLAHYVREHHLQLPAQFTAHVAARVHELQNARVDELWWSQQRRKQA